jgi:preprotein translocase subunit SecG
MITILTIFHVIVSLFLIFVVLLQQGKGQDIAGAFGGGGSQTVFGARGAGTLLTKATTAAAIIFMITSLALTILISNPTGSSVIREGATAPAGTTPPPVNVTPAPAGQPPATGQPQTPPATPPGQ